MDLRMYYNMLKNQHHTAYIREEDGVESLVYDTPYFNLSIEESGFLQFDVEDDYLSDVLDILESAESDNEKNGSFFLNDGSSLASKIRSGLKSSNKAEVSVSDSDSLTEFLGYMEGSTIG